MATQIFFLFTPKIGEDSHFDSYFTDGLVQPPTRSFFFREESSTAKLFGGTVVDVLLGWSEEKKTTHRKKSMIWMYFWALAEVFG